MRYLLIKCIFPPMTEAGKVPEGWPTDHVGRQTTEMKVPVLETMRIGDILELEQILNRSTVARFHVTVEEDEG